jgi:signal transduction histidine kinase/DNA-binding NarL/FixJ family response regulator
LRRDGVEFPIEVRLSALKTGEGLLLFSAIRDASERKNAEQRSRQLEIVAAEAEAANKAKSMFISTMSHEIRTPMNAILGYSQLMLRDANLGMEAKANLKIINRSGEHLLHMINDILDLAKIEAGHEQLRPRAFDLPGLLRDLEAMFRLRAEAKGLQLAVTVDGEPLQYIAADDGKIRQVLINLLGNAVKFTERGRINLRVTLHLRPDEGLWLSICVSDTGCGMTVEEKNSLFEPFTQGRAGQRTRDGGTGLGLAISQKVARLMGGAITASSTLGEGSSFVFEIPVRPARERDFHKHSGPGKRVIGLEAGMGRPRILIADDLADNREWLGKLLTTLGFVVRSADNGEAAILISEQWCPQLILMDMHMPVMNGLEATRRIRTLPNGHDIVVIALTADAMDDYRRFVLKSTVNGFITKPCTEDDLLEMIGKHLGLAYIYEDEAFHPHEELADSVTRATLSPTRLREVPEDLVRQLRLATLCGDKALLDELIPMTEGKTDAQTARALQDLADDYQYDKLIQLLEKAWPN